MPFNALNYIGGITAIRFRDYWWATCVGIAPNIIWTIFVGATFGTVNARGVDGNKEFDQNGVRKGVVLGLGIGLGVMGLVWTGVYARQELTKIVIAEQRERAMEDHGAGAGSDEEHLITVSGGECEAIPEEEGADNHSLSLDDIENPQLGENMEDDYLNDPEGSGIVGSSSDSLFVTAILSNTNHSETSSPSSRLRRTQQQSQQQQQQQQSWTPETVAAELPILPKMIHQYLSPIISSQSSGLNNLGSVFGSDAETPTTPVAGASVGGRKNNKIFSASTTPPLPCRSFQVEEEVDPGWGNRSLEHVIKKRSHSSSPTPRYTIQQNITFDSIKADLSLRLTTPDSSSSRPRASSNPMNDDNVITGLAGIDEMKVLSPDHTPSKNVDASQSFMTPTVDPSREEKGNRRRCSTDPTDKGKRYTAVSSTEIIGNEVIGGGRSNSSAINEPSPRREWLQLSPLWTPSKNKGLKTRHSFHDLAKHGTPVSQQQNHHQNNNNQQQEQYLNEGKTSSPQQEEEQDQHRRRFERSTRSNSLPHSPSGNHFELSGGNFIEDREEGQQQQQQPDREWFWIWA
eukprot:CAMPEP_0183728568 /NCGR_PEP_ID=MMETSP0737-20130205/28378_1 /TAXON_ID=385413 /ORGANISM="Thalassiosira miniscula, Strain CCMP1093" /LENGTH=570 /DNA_ID=CAMNT_0025960553 /DNA_START=53 /DNA_END=1765 /DNA_ORIENTATION=-